MNTRPLLITVLATALAGMAAPSFAHHSLVAAAVNVDLKDGSTLYVFKDGRMAKADRLGRPAHLKKGEVLEARDGRQVTTVGNEVARLAWLIGEGHEN
jgi:hypothetical protein